MSDFATTPEEFDIDFWETDLGRKTMAVVTALDQGKIPDQAMVSMKEVLQLHHDGSKINEMGEFNASQQAINLVNLLNKSMQHYMPGGFIDDSRASPSDIKNLISTASSVVKLVNQVQNELYTADRMAAMERAIFKTFETIPEEIPGITPDMHDAIKKSFRAKLELAFSSL